MKEIGPYTFAWSVPSYEKYTSVYFSGCDTQIFYNSMIYPYQNGTSGAIASNPGFYRVDVTIQLATPAGRRTWSWLC